MDLKSCMERVAQGDKEAFAEIYNAYNGKVYAQAAEELSDPESIRLVIKRTFREVYLTLSEGPYRRNFDAWIHRLAEEEIDALLDEQEKEAEERRQAQRAAAAMERAERRRQGRRREEEPEPEMEEWEDRPLPRWNVRDDRDTYYEEEPPRRRQKENPYSRVEPIPQPGRRDQEEAFTEEQESRRERRRRGREAFAEADSDARYDREESRRERRRSDREEAFAEADSDARYDREEPRREQRRRNRDDRDGVHHYSRQEAEDIRRRTEERLRQPDQQEDWKADAEQEEWEEEDYPTYTVPIIIGFVLLVILLWFAAGLMMRNQMIPPVDLGYSWFNIHLFPLF